MGRPFLSVVTLPQFFYQFVKNFPIISSISFSFLPSSVLRIQKIPPSTEALASTTNLINTSTEMSVTSSTTQTTTTTSRQTTMLFTVLDEINETDKREFGKFLLTTVFLKM